MCVCVCVCGFYVICVCVCVVLGIKQEPNSVPSGRGSMPDGPEEKEVGGKKRDMELGQFKGKGQ